MNQKELTRVVERRINTIRNLIESKGSEYAEENNRLKNFSDGAFMNGTTKEVYLWNLVSKHIIALKDFIHGRPASKEQWLEKIGDIINYMILLEALVEEPAKKQ